MKKLSFVVVLMLAINLLIPTVFAEKVADISMYYDFSNYKGGLADANWIVGEAGSAASFKAVEDKGNTCMSINSWAEPVLKFPRVVKGGNIHISFDAKVSSGSKLMMGSYDCRTNDDISSQIASQYYSKMISVREGSNAQIVYYCNNDKAGNDLIKWNAVEFKPEDISDFYHELEWNHYDIFAEDMEAVANPTMRVYINGTCLNPDNPLYFKNSKGFTGLNFLSESAVTYIDNVSFENYYGAAKLSLIGNGSRVDLKDGTASFSLSESVDANTLVKENFTITDAFSGKEINNFEINNVTNSTFDIDFEGDLPRGLYNVMLDSSIVGKITGAYMQYPGQFKTEYAYIKIGDTYLEENFNDFVSGCPKGWTFLNDKLKADEVECVKVIGEDETNAAGISNGSYKSTIKKPRFFVHQFKESVDKGSGMSVDFDVKFSSKMYWYFSLLDDETNFETLPENYDFGIANTGAKLQYALTKGTSISGTVSDDALGYDTWHHINVTVTPNKDNTSTYKFVVDGGTAKEVVSKRDFGSETISGVAFAYEPRNATNSFAIDNINVSSAKDVLLPEVAQINYIDRNGEAQNGDISSATSRIEIDFNTVVNEDTIDDAISFKCDKEIIEYYVEKETLGTGINEHTRATIVLPHMLRGDALFDHPEYTLFIDGIVQSTYSEELLSLPYRKVFTTKDDQIFSIYNENLSKGAKKGAYSTSILKTDEEPYKFMFMVAAYKNVTVDGKTYKNLVDCSYIPVVLSEGDRGLYNYETEVNYDSCDKIEVFKLDYPQMTVQKEG